MRRFVDILILIDSLGLQSNIEPIGKTITQPKNTRRKIEKSKKKCIDDFTVLAAIDLKSTLDCPLGNQAEICATGEIRQNIKFVTFWCVFLAKIKVDPESC